VVCHTILTALRRCFLVPRRQPRQWGRGRGLFAR
jgi:hypothetical protein